MGYNLIIKLYITMYKYEATQTVYDFLESYDGILFKKEDISNNINLPNDKIYKALSTLTNDNTIIRLKQGLYANLLNKKIRNSKDDTVLFNWLKRMLGEKYKGLELSISPLRLAYKNFFTTQRPANAHIIFSKDKVNEDHRLFAKIFGLMSKSNVKELKVHRISRYSYAEIIADYLEISRRGKMSDYIEVLNNNLHKYFTIEKDTEVYFGDDYHYNNLMRLVYGKIDHIQYHKYLNNGFYDYILKEKDQ